LLDPACGCGNFFDCCLQGVAAAGNRKLLKQRLKLEGFREEVVREAKIDVGYLVQCDVDKFYGIELRRVPGADSTGCHVADGSSNETN
jgi:hypothetical protein